MAAARRRGGEEGGGGGAAAAAAALLFDFAAASGVLVVVVFIVVFSAGVGVRRDSAPVVPSSGLLPAAWALRLDAVLRVETILVSFRVFDFWLGFFSLVLCWR